MKTFHFRLQPLLNKERIFENECIGRLRVVQHEYLNEKGRLVDLENCRKKSLVELTSRRQKLVTSEGFRAYEAYLLKLGSDIDKGKIRLQEMEKGLMVIQDELGKIVKKRKALEKLRDRWEEEYKEYIVALSNKEMDDIAMAKFFRNLVDGNA